MTDEHTFADVEDAPERYLLGQMSEADRERYEQHFFACPRCAEEVKATARFMDTCRDLLAAPQPKVLPWRRAWFPRTSTAIVSGALAATLALAVYQNVFTIPALRQSATPGALTAFSFVAFNSRGAADRTIVAPRDQPFLIYFDIPPGQHAGGYDCRILAEDGRATVTAEVSEEKAQETVPFMIPAGELAPGTYALVVTARTDGSKPPAEVVRFPFTLRFAD
jgi:Putative zinc-finger